MISPYHQNVVNVSKRITESFSKIPLHTFSDGHEITVHLKSASASFLKSIMESLYALKTKAPSLKFDFIFTSMYIDDNKVLTSPRL